MHNETRRNFRQAETGTIKRELTQHFGWRFSVARSRGTASRYINVRWTNGPTMEAVDGFLSQFNDTAHDDIMTDLWCGSQYTSTHRDYDPEGAWMALSGLDLRNGLPPAEAVFANVAGILSRRGGAKSWRITPTDFELKAERCVWDLQDAANALKALGYEAQADLEAGTLRASVVLAATGVER